MEAKKESKRNKCREIREAVQGLKEKKTTKREGEQGDPEKRKRDNVRPSKSSTGTFAASIAVGLT